MKEVDILRPTVSQAMELLGKWVVCRVNYPECGEVHCTEPSRIVGVVVPAPGSSVRAQLLMADGEGCVGLAVEGYDYYLFLEDVRSLQVVDAVAHGTPSKGMGTKIHARVVAALTAASSGSEQSEHDDESLVRLIESRSAEPARVISLDEL